MEIKDVRRYIAQFCLEHIKYGEGNLIFNTFTGSGKTTTVLKTIYEAEDGFNWMYFAPYHKVIEENIELSKVIDFQGFIHLESRAKLCLSTKDYKPLAQQGINITPFCENFCRLKDTRCPYYDNLRKLREIPTCVAAVHAHIPTLMQRLFYEKWQKRALFTYYDIIIIDEFPSSTLYNQIAINKYDISYARDILQMTAIHTDESRILMLVLDELALATQSIGINYNKISAMIDNFRGLKFDDFRSQYDEKILKLIMKGKIRSPPQDIIYFLTEFWSLRPSPQDLKWMIYKGKHDQWHTGKIYLTISNLYYFQKLPVKTIALDGTADLPTWKSILGQESQSISFDIEYKNVYQTIGARNPISTILKKGDLTPSGQRLFVLLCAICDYKQKKVIVCASKRVQRILTKYFKKKGIDNYEFATYYNLRSRNSYYEECDTCVVFHEPNIPPFQSEIIRNVLGWNEEIIIKVHREDEIRQGIGRNRQNIPTTPRGRKRGIREIFIFSSTGHKKLVPEAKYMMYEDMLSYAQGGKKRLFFEKLKELIKDNAPISKTGLSKALGFSSQKTTFLLNILQNEGVVRVEWGRIHWLRDVEPEEEEKYLIKLGFNR